ncbi:MAG: hypothetical protein PHH77_01250 [Victivallaceae bacterium]|nr:hypothetical protein [Victivallaceae bacterium]
MIKLADTSIMLTDAEGVTSVFDPDRLQSRIIRSFLAAGITESCLADDISLAVEFSLRKSKRKEKIFTFSEINNVVVRILKDTGFPEIAAIYERSNTCSRMTVDPEFNTIRKLFRKHLGINHASLDDICGKVIAAARQLGIKNAAPGLFVELAKHYESADFSDTDIEPVSLAAWEQDNRWLVSTQAIARELAVSARGLAEAGVIRLIGVSSMFPSIRVFFMINEFCRFHGLGGPLTEMVLMPYLFSAGKAVDNCITTIERLAAEQAAGKDLPIFLTIPDMSSFAVQLLEASWPEAENDCREMIAPLCNSLTRPLFKLKLS